MRTILAAALILGATTAHALPLPPQDPMIAALLAQISADRLRASDSTLVAFGTRSTFSEHAAPGRGVVAARDWIRAQFTAIASTTGGRMAVALDEYVQQPDGRRIPRAVPISSVVATLHGSDPGTRTYVISSHYDSRNTDNSDGTNDAPGADDNGSGTAAVLEAARVLAPTHPRATIIFATYDAEEQGLLGSAHHAQSLRAAGTDVQGDLNNDIIGASVGDQGQKNPGMVRIFSEALPPGTELARTNTIGTESDSPSRELARAAAELTAAYTRLHPRLIFRADRFLRGGDHESFNAVAYPAIRFVEPVETFAHQHQNVRTENAVQYGDLQRFMDFSYLADVTRANVATLATLAFAPAPPKPFVLTKDLTNTTTLSWSPVPNATRYEILRRLTTEATWTDVTDAKDATSITLPYSKDDYIFGVRAVDAQNHASVAAYPTPRK